MFGIPDKYFWPGLVIALLGSSMAMWGTMLYKVETIDQPQVVENYYQKAVDYDYIEATRAAARQTGWKVDVDASGQQAKNVHIDVVDRSGKPVTGLKGTVSMHRPDLGKAVGVAKLEPVRGQPGRYAVGVHPNRAGLWDFVIKTKHDGQALQFKVREEVSL